MTLIPNSVLDNLRRTSESAMPDAVVIERPGGAWGYDEDEGGGRAPFPLPPTRITTKGRIGPVESVTSREAERAGQVRQDGAEKLVVPLSVDVRGTDLVVVTSARFGTVTRYTIEEVRPLGTYAVDRTLIVKPEV